MRAAFEVYEETVQALQASTANLALVVRTLEDLGGSYDALTDKWSFSCKMTVPLSNLLEDYYGVSDAVDIFNRTIDLALKEME